MIDKKVNGKIVMEEIKFNRVLERKVSKNNGTSGKLSVPRNLIGKKVLIIIPKMKRKRGRKK
jgi:putative transposon-encoded protein